MINYATEFFFLSYRSRSFCFRQVRHFLQPFSHTVFSGVNS